MSLYTRIIDLGAFGLISGAKLLMMSYPSGSLTLVNASHQSDGFGAQFQRILSIKALADSLKIQFRLEPLRQIERQLTQKHLPVEEHIKEIEAFNVFLESLFASSAKVKDSDVSSYFVDTLPQMFLTLLRSFLPVLFLKKKIEVRIENAYRFIQFNANLYSKLEYNHKAIEKIESNDEIKISVHLRFVNFATNTERYLDPEYYYESLNQITRKLNHLGTRYKINLHSDFKEALPTPSKLGISKSTFEYLMNIGVSGQDGEVDLDTFNRAIECKTRIIREYENVIEIEANDPLSSLKVMANSDYLILSKSSFAFVAGVLNKKGQIISPEYWNLPLNNWNEI